MIKYIIIAFASAGFSFALTPAVRRLALRLRVVDMPGGRRIHAVPTARLGGAALLPAVLCGLAFAAITDPFVRKLLSESDPWRLAALAASCTCVTVLGAIDDRHSLKALTKLAVEVIAAVFVVAAGYRVESLFGVEIGWFSASVTVIWIVAVTNAINMVDGLDGLAAGIGLIASATLFSIALLLGNISTAIILAAVCGALLGFLVHNFHPAKIFLGDSGSLLIGFLLAVTAIESSNKAATTAAILCPLLALGLPLSEILLTTLRRTLKGIRVVRLDAGERRYRFSGFAGSTLFTADREHIHHRLLALGLTHRNAVLLLYAVCAVLGGCSFLMAAYKVTNLGLLLVAFVIVMIAARRLGYNELRPLNNGLLLPLFDFPGINRNLVYVLCDLGFIGASYIGAWLIQSNWDLSRASMARLLDGFPLLAASQMAGFTVAGLYRRSYRYAGIEDLLVIGRSVGLAIVAGSLALIGVGNQSLPGFMVLDAYLLGTFVFGARLSFPCLDYLFNVNRPGMQRVLIYGAGGGGIAATREMRLNPALNMRPVGFLDDDVRKTGQLLQGVAIHPLGELEHFINRHEIDAVVIATRKIPLERLKNVIQRCTLAGISVRMFRMELDEIGTQAGTTARALAPAPTEEYYLSH